MGRREIRGEKEGRRGGGCMGKEEEREREMVRGEVDGWERQEGKKGEGREGEKD